MIAILVFFGSLGLCLNVHMLMDNIAEERYAITPINIIGIIFSVTTIILGIGGYI